LAGPLVTVDVQGVRIVRIWHLLKQSRPAGAEVTGTVQRVAARMNLRAPEVRLSSHIRSPFICALGRAVLLWPESMRDEIAATGRQAIVVHELAHVARRDHFVGWLELVAGCLWWWNPLFWHVRHQLRESAELACDAWVLGLFPEARRPYARALIDLAEFDSVEHRVAPAFGVGALGAGKGSRNLFERRLVMIMRDNVRYRLGAGGIIGIGVLALAVLPGCSASQAGDEPLTTGATAAADPFAPERLPEPVRAESQQKGNDPFVPLAADPGPQKGPAPEVPVLPTQEGTPASIGTVPVLDNDGSKQPGSGLSPVAEGTPPTNSNEERIKRLEDRLEAILSELRAMKNPSGKGPASNATPMLPPATGSDKSKSLRPPSEGQTQPAVAGQKQYKREMLHSIMKPADVETTALTRATYKLPAGRAQAVATFLADNLTDEIEVRVKENALQVTANNEDQARIAQFIQLLQMRGSPVPKPSAPKTEPLSDTKRDIGFDSPVPAKAGTNRNFEDLPVPAGLQKK
jgi:hypothetical protein